VDRRIVFDAYAHSAAPDPASSSGSAFNDVAASQVSGRVFGAADGVDRRVAVFDASTLAPLPSLDDGQFVYAVDTHWSGKMASMDSRPLSATHAIVIYDDSGAVLTTLSHADADVQPKGLVFSADGTRLLSVAGSLPHIDAVP